MDYSMTLYLRQVWLDDRLAYKSYNRSITLNHNQFDRLWTPDVFIRNLKEGVFHSITVPNRMIRLFPDGKVLYSQRLTLTLACEMKLDKYPMDNQTCNIEFGSYAYTTEDLIFHWRSDAIPVEMSTSISLPEYVITNTTHIVCSKKFSSTGSFPCLRAHFHLVRRIRAYILTTYLPSFLVVLLSWLSFWIDFESAPARTSLSILTILTITTQSSGMLRSMPAGSVTKAIDVWMATCLVFVFGAFIEYSVVNTLARRQKKAAAKKKQFTEKIQQESVATTRPNGWQGDHVNFSVAPPTAEYHRLQTGQPLTAQQGAPMGSTYPQLSSHARVNSAYGPLASRSGSVKTAPVYYSESPAIEVTWWVKHTTDKAMLVEVISRVLFPFMFLIFNMVYWPMYLL